MQASALKRMYALGRLKAGEMNKTEKAYAEHLEKLRLDGAVVWYKFEGLKFRLADNTFYTPDFVVMTATGELEVHEVKGSSYIFQDDAKVKVQVASEMYPLKFFVAFPQKGSRNAKWNLVEY